MTETKTKYSVLIGLLKTAKNSGYLLVPFLVAVLAGVPAEYGWIAGPLTYFVKNWFENKN